MAGLFSRTLQCLCKLVAVAIPVTLWAAPPAKPWVPFGPDGGDARRLAPDPRDHAHLYMGTANGWIYESRNSGSSWKRLAQPGKRDDLVLDSIVVDASNPSHLVVGAWVIDRPDGGIYLSSDGGATWTNQAEMRGQSVLSLAASPSDPRTLVAGTQHGVFRSGDAGQRWSRISPEDSAEIHNVQSVAIDPMDPKVIYAGTWHLPWKSVDGGEHWNSIKAGIIEDSDVFSIIVDPEQPHTVFASACSGIYKSEDAGLEFHKIQGIPTTARRTRRLLQDPNDLKTVFAGTTEGLWRSPDSGKSWTRITGPETIVNDVQVDRTDSRHVLIATDRGGVLASDDGGDTFHPSNGGFSARQITTMKRDNTHPDRLFVGVVNDKDWGGVFQSEDGGQTWMQRSEGLEGRDVFALGQAGDGTVVAGTSHGLFLLDATALTWKRVEAAPGTPAVHVSVQAILTRPPVPPGARGHLSNQPPAPAASRTAAQKKKGTKPTVAQHRPRSRAEHAALHRSTPAKARKPVTGPKIMAKSVIRPATAPKRELPASVAAQPHLFDGSVFAIASTGDTLLATTSVGLLSSVDNGVTWVMAGPEGGADWRFLATAKRRVIVASLHASATSADGGLIWEPVKLPEQLTQISAAAIEPTGEIWVGGREGIFVSNNNGAIWTVPKNLALSAVNNIFYDDAADRLMITTAGNSNLIFQVQMPDKLVTFVDAGWSLRFARPLADHLVAATLYDGIVVQPRMVASPVPSVPAVQPPPGR